jgi:hypothetical protein
MSKPFAKLHALYCLETDVSFAGSGMDAVDCHEVL